MPISEMQRISLEGSESAQVALADSLYVDDLLLILQASGKVEISRSLGAGGGGGPSTENQEGFTVEQMLHPRCRHVIRFAAKDGDAGSCESQKD